MKKLLICPKCKGTLYKNNNSLTCESKHTYDIAKQGYVNLVLGSKGGQGDDTEMCRARHEFHNGDYYACLADKLSEICLRSKIYSIIDAGCGEGYYLRKIRDAYEKNGKSLVSACGIDLAKEAIAIAAKSEKMLPEEQRIEYAVAGIFDMPVSDKSCDCVLSVFAPVAFSEAHRVLCDSGILIVVSPGEKHLDGLKKAIYCNVYDNEVTAKDYDGFELSETRTAKDSITVMDDNIKNLFHMTPYYWKTSGEDAEKLSELTSLSTKIEFVIRIYKKV